MADKWIAMRGRFVVMGMAYLLAAILLTYPLAFHLTTHLPIGTEPAATVPLFNLWTLLWNADRLAALYQGYWHAPIFFPTAGTFALSEPQPLTGLLFAPLFYATNNAPLAYNLIFLLHLTLNGVSAYTLVRRLEGGASTHPPTSLRKDTPLPAFFAGLFAQTLPFISNEWGVLQLTALYPIFFTFTALIAWTRHPTLKNAFLLGFWVAALFWSSIYYGLFVMPFVGLYGVGWLFAVLGKRKAESRNDQRTEHHKGTKEIKKDKTFFRRFRFPLSAFRTGLFALAIAALLLFPVIEGQLRYTAGYSRSAETIQNNSAEPIDYLQLSSRTWGNRLLWLAQEGGSGQRLYPGTGVLLLGVVGIFIGWRRGQRGWVLYALVSIVLAFLLSLGLNGQIGGLHPYEGVREWLPGYRQLRSPFRLAVVVQFFLLSLAGVALSGVVGWLDKNAPRRKILLGVAVAFFIMEVFSFPARLYRIPPATFDAAWLAWFRIQPAGAAVYLPFVEGTQAAAYETTTLAMVQSLNHRHPLANGYSGFFPERHDFLKAQMQDFPSYPSITTLQAMGVRYLIVAADWEFLHTLPPWGMLQERYHDNDVVIFEIVG